MSRYEAMNSDSWTRLFRQALHKRRIVTPGIGFSVEQAYLHPLQVYYCVLFLGLPLCRFRLMNDLVYFFLIAVS